MTSRATAWLSGKFRRIADRSGCGPLARGSRLARPALEILEGRKLLSDASAFWSFASAPKLHPAKLNLLTRKPGASLDRIFVAPYAASSNSGAAVGQTGPLIADATGNPIWYQPVSNKYSPQVLGFRAQTLFGRPVLTWWQGTLVGSTSAKLPPGTAVSGEFVIANQHYQKIRTIPAPQGVGLDLHELLLTPQGHAYFITNRTVRADLTAYGGSKQGTYLDPVVRELDLRTGKTVFTLDVAKHVPLGDSVVPATAGKTWDPYHLNSVDVSPDGSQVLVSARNTWGIYDVSHTTGNLLWQLGGKENQFHLPSSLVTGPFGSAFQYQHDARFVPGGISLYDNAGAGSPPYGGPYGASRGLTLNLDLQNHAASLASPPDVHDPALFSNSQGNLQNLANGHVLIGSGLNARPGGGIGSHVTEYSRSGSVLADYLLDGQQISYRAFSLPWAGLPLTKPSVAGASANGRTTVYASWNGSTETQSWELLAGPSRASLSQVSITPRSGFETAIATTAAGPFFEVKALDAGGNTLNTSAVIRVRG
ncbi:MAG: hypothetical protein JWN86_1096 [Planctomycetota bacterium]|nr:hypothetical protein [Planctomycetota bacterium]